MLFTPYWVSRPCLSPWQGDYDKAQSCLEKASAIHYPDREKLKRIESLDSRPKKLAYAKVRDRRLCCRRNHIAMLCDVVQVLLVLDHRLMSLRHCCRWVIVCCPRGAAALESSPAVIKALLLLSHHQLLSVRRCCCWVIADIIEALLSLSHRHCCPPGSAAAGPLLRGDGQRGEQRDHASLHGGDPRLRWLGARALPPREVLRQDPDDDRWAGPARQAGVSRRRAQPAAGRTGGGVNWWQVGSGVNRQRD